MDQFSEKYKGYTITLNRLRAFAVSGGDEFKGVFASYKSATEGIDSHLKDKLATTRSPIRLAVVTEQGIPGAITGLNIANGDYTGIKKIAGDRGNVVTPNLYPDTPEIRRLTKERNDAVERVKRLDEILVPLAIRSRHTYGRLDSISYDRMINSLKDEYQAKLAAAHGVKEV